MSVHFARIDDALIDRLFQPLADLLDRHMAFGTNRAARTGIDLASLAWVLAEAGGAAHALAAHGLPAAMARGLVMLLGLSAFTILRNVFHGTRRRLAANPLRPGMQPHRAICLAWMAVLAVKTLLVPADFAALALLAVGVFATAAVYIGACTNPPPARREARAGLWNRALAGGSV